MVLQNLKIRVISENIKFLRIEPSNYQWCFSIECSQCQSLQPNDIYFFTNDEVEMHKGHGTANFMMKCKECKKSMTIQITKTSQFSIDCESGNEEGVFATFDCRGCFLKKWNPGEGIILESLNTSELFENVDISDVWCEYDKSNTSCSLLEPVYIQIENS
jgi:hypothetical protein